MKGWVEMPSGRMATVWNARYGFVGMSAWPDGTWSIRFRECMNEDKRREITGTSKDLASAIKCCETEAWRRNCHPLINEPEPE